MSSLSTTSSLKSAGSSSIDGGVSLDLQPQSFLVNSITKPPQTIHPIIDTQQNNNNHTKSSSSFDSCIEFSKKSSSKSPSSLGSVCESIGFDSMSYRTKSRGSLSSRSSSSGGDIGPPEYDLGPHREMAVDVPDNFVAVAKVPPRYPNKNALQKSKESLISTNSTIINDATTTPPTTTITTTNSQTINHITTPQTTIRNTEVFILFCFVFFFYLFNKISFFCLFI